MTYRLLYLALFLLDKGGVVELSLGTFTSD